MAKRMENEKEIAFPDTIPSFIGFRILIKKEENNYKKITIRKKFTNRIVSWKKKREKCNDVQLFLKEMKENWEQENPLRVQIPITQCLLNMFFI